MSSLFRLEQQQNPFRICMSLLFLLIWNWNNIFAHTLSSRSSLKPYLIPDQNEWSLYLFSDQNSAKTLLLGGGGGAHNYMAYVREYLPPG